MNKLATAVRMRERMPQQAYKIAEEEAKRNIALGIVDHLTKLQGQTVVYRIARMGWEPRMWMGFREDEYQIQLEVMDVRTVRVDPYMVYESGPITWPRPEPPPTTRELVGELWRRFKRHVMAAEPCSYTKPQSAYPRPETFFM